MNNWVPLCCHWIREKDPLEVVRGVRSDNTGWTGTGQGSLPVSVGYGYLTTAGQVLVREPLPVWAKKAQGCPTFPLGMSQP